MSCNKCSSCIQVLIILAIVGYSLAMLVLSISEYSDYEDLQNRINTNIMNVTCSEICGLGYAYRDAYTCCSSTYSCSSRYDCKTKKLADLDALMQEAAEKILIFTVVTVIILYCLCKNKCQPCRDLCERNPYNYNRNFGYDNRSSLLIEPIHLDQEPIIVYRQ